MGRMNFRDAYEVDPETYGSRGDGGLLALLQAMMQQGQVQSGADLNRIPGNGAPTTSQPSYYGQAPSTRITVRPFDAYSPPASETGGGEGGLLGRLLALQAAQSGYQPTPGNGGPVPSAVPDPNFRQLSRAPFVTRPPGAIRPQALASQQPGNPVDAYSNGYGQPVLSDVSPDPVRPGSQYAQALGLCLGGPAACAVGGGITLGQAILGGSALLGGATILNQARKGGGRKSSDDEDGPYPSDDPEWYDRKMKEIAEGVAARARERGKAVVRTKVVGNDPGDYCANRHQKEVDRCYKRSHEYPHWDFLQGCIDRAKARRDMCVANKGRPDLGEPDEWGSDDDEVYRNHSR